MSSLAFLVTELQVGRSTLVCDVRESADDVIQSLASETRRKHPEIREVLVIVGYSPTD